MSNLARLKMATNAATSGFGRLLVAIVLAIAPIRAAPAAEPPLVAAASDLQFALTEIAAAFTAETGEPVRLSFGSSGNFARQVRAGAPIELFLSADEDLVAALVRDGLTASEGAVYAEGRLVLIVPKGSPLEADGTLGDLALALSDGRLTKFAIANPEHAPYGQRAKEVLVGKGLWDSISSRLVYGENVSQAAQFATSGSTQGGIIALSLALSPVIAASGVASPIPAQWHRPLRQSMVLTKHAGPVARRLFAYLKGAQARAVLERNGFTLPAQD